MKIPIDHITTDRDVDVSTEEYKEFVDSIREHGVINPITVRRVNGSGDQYELIAGLKRLKAALITGKTEIDVEVRDGIDDIQRKILLVHENLHQHNVPWNVAAELIAQLHELRQAMHGKGKIGRPKEEVGKQGWGMRDTANELGVALGRVAEDMNLAREVRLDPSLSKIGDRKTALRVVAQRAAQRRNEMEQALPTTVEYNQVYCGDSATILKAFPANTFDGCVTDPPWIKFFDKSLTIDKRTLPVFRELYRVLKYDTMTYIFCGLDDMVYYAGYDVPDPNGDDDNPTRHVPGELEKIGFKISKTPIFWHKLNSLSRRGVKNWEYDRDFEVILIAAKGNPTVTSNTRMSSIKTFAVVPSVKLIHPNEKPVELIINLLEDSTFKGSLIVDPFGGSGVTGLACKKTERKFVVCERDKKSYDKICQRLEVK